MGDMEGGERQAGIRKVLRSGGRFLIYKLVRALFFFMRCLLKCDATSCCMESSWGFWHEVLAGPLLCASLGGFGLWLCDLLELWSD